MGLTTCCAQGATRQRWRTLQPGKERAGQHWRWPYRSRRMGRRCGGPRSQQDLLQSRWHVVAECKEHSQTAGLDLLHLQLSESVRVVSQNQRVEGLTRVEQMQIPVQLTTLHTIGLPARMEWACTRLELPR